MAMCPILSPNSNQKYKKSFISFALLSRYPTLNGYQQLIEEEDNSSMLDLLASPPSTTSSTNTSNTKCYKHLQSLQLQLEIESLTLSTTKQLEIYNSARDRSDYNTIPVVKRALDDWYKELNDVIEIEQWFIHNDKSRCVFLEMSLFGSFFILNA